MKKPYRHRQGFMLFASTTLKRCNTFLQLRLEVGRLILVNNVSLGQLIQHRCDKWEALFGFFLIGQCTKIADRVSRSLVIVLIVQLLSVVATNSF